MTEISPNVNDGYLSSNQNHREILKPFLVSGFSVTWAKKVYSYNTTVALFFLLPEMHIQESYGFETEVVLAYSEYETLEPRVIQSIEFNMDSSPAKGRVDKLTYFLVSNDKNVEEWVASYKSQTNSARIIIPIDKHQLLMNVANPWYIRNILGQYFFGRDLYDYTLPLTKDDSFFGRQQLCANYFDAIKRFENKGLFGLRKTGKTSFLFKLQRMIAVNEWGFVIYIDCKLPKFRNLHWKDLLKYIGEEITKGLVFPKTKIDLSKSGDNIIYDIFHSEEIKTTKKHVAIFFDEIEYISYYAKLDKHWAVEFIDFWQTLWSIQSETKAFSFMITGVNPNVIEESTVCGVQNPLFGIVRYEYLKGFEFEECKMLITKLGKRMGLDYEYDGIKYIYDRYGGHPLLTRIACSLVNKRVQFQKSGRPYEIKKKFLVEDQDQRDNELTYYCGHVVSELKEFYSDEYEMLEMLATGLVADFNELSSNIAFVKHLDSYGLVAREGKSMPRIAIPVLGTYIAKEKARKNKSTMLLALIKSDDRQLWIERRKDLVLQDFKIWEKLIAQNNRPSLYGCNSFCSMDEFVKMLVVSSKQQYSYYINTIFKCLYESLESYGNSIGKRNYIKDVIKTEYPSYYIFLDKISIYRNEQDHLNLYNNISEKLKFYLDEDLLGQTFSSIQDPYFALQQKTLDSLLTSLQIEISMIS